jgi:hypothetical protein
MQESEQRVWVSLAQAWLLWGLVRAAWPLTCTLVGLIPKLNTVHAGIGPPNLLILKLNTLHTCIWQILINLMHQA